MRPLALDLFCGAVGGWSQGLHRAGIETVAACEIDEWRRGVFSAQFPAARIYPDVRELSAATLVRDLGQLPDIVVGSPPCQDASAANTKGRGVDGERTGLFFEAIRLVSEIRPAWCAFENSPRLRTRGFDRIADELEAIGYPCWPLVVGARHAGANHRRERVWIIAADADRSSRWKSALQDGAPANHRHGPDAPGKRCDEGQPEGQQGIFSASGARRIGGNDTPDPDGRQPCGAGRHSNGCVELGAGTDGPDARHASLKPGLRQRRVLRRSVAEPAEACLCDAADTNEAGHQVGQGEPRDDGAQLPPALRDIGRAWSHWNGGLAGLSASCAAAGFGAVDDGAEAIMAPGLRNRAIAALGDAILPQISEAIGRTMIAALQWNARAGGE